MAGVTVDGCCGNKLIVGWRRPNQQPFMRTMKSAAAPPIPTPMRASPAAERSDAAPPSPPATSSRRGGQADAVLGVYTEWLRALSPDAPEAVWRDPECLHQFSGSAACEAVLEELRCVHRSIHPAITHLVELSDDQPDTPLTIDVCRYTVDIRVRRDQHGTPHLVPDWRVRNLSFAGPQIQMSAADAKLCGPSPLPQRRKPTADGDAAQAEVVCARRAGGNAAAAGSRVAAAVRPADRRDDEASRQQWVTPPAVPPAAAPAGAPGD